MQVYLVRHAIAYPRDPESTRMDSARELTPAGIARFRQTLPAYVRLGIVLDEVWTSPYARARQTAELLCGGLDLTRPPKLMPELEPDGQMERLLPALELNADRKAIALVGHEPALSELVGLLLTGQRSSLVEFKKGGVCCIEARGFGACPDSQLQWLLTPKQLRWIGK
jgi:phosphohistidine phosphatase